MNKNLLPIHFAPLQGYTDAAYRQAHACIFGGIDTYYSPFVRVEHGEIRRNGSRVLLQKLVVCQSAEYAGQGIHRAFHALLHQLFVQQKPLRRIILVNPLEQDAHNAEQRHQRRHGLQQTGSDVPI